MSALWPNGSTTQPRISDGYGPRTGIAGARPFHYGVDIPLTLGSPIRAARDAKVVFSGTNGTLGEQVVIDDGLHQFLYSHMAAGSRTTAKTVRQGDIVGRVGLTGLTTGPHTCYRTFAGDWRSDDAARNPVDVMAAYNAASTAGGGTRPPITITNEEEDAMRIVQWNTDKIAPNGLAFDDAVFAISGEGIRWLNADEWNAGGEEVAAQYGGLRSVDDDTISRMLDVNGIPFTSLEAAFTTGRFQRVG